MLIDLLLNHPFQRRWNSLRTFLPIINAFAGRNTGLIFIAPSARLLDNLGNLNTQGPVGGLDKAVRKRFGLSRQTDAACALQLFCKLP